MHSNGGPLERAAASQAAAPALQPCRNKRDTGLILSARHGDDPAMGRWTNRCGAREALRTMVAAVLVTGFLFVLAEGGLRLFGVLPMSVTKDPYVGFAGSAPIFVPVEDGQVWETAESKREYFPVQRFSARKPDGTVRIFCLGGSTTAGRPYEDSTSFCAWLRELLPEADPTRTWEVINAGGISYASYRVVRVMEELLAHDPDVFIVYSGHNEFLERRTYGPRNESEDIWTRLAKGLGHTRLYTAVAQWGSSARPTGALLPAEVFAILDRSVGPEAYTRDDAYAAAVEAHFQANLLRMTALARTVGASMVFVTPASNITDCPPFKSEPDPSLTVNAREALASVFTKAQDDPARYTDCLTIDPRLPEAHYQYGRYLLEEGRPKEAREHLLAARDEDICPLRATSRLIDLVRATARETGTPLVDYVELLDGITDGLPGDAYFVDHVHPTIEAHGLLARKLLNGLYAAGVLSEQAHIADDTFDQIQKQILARVDNAGRARALRTLARVHAWAGKHDQAIAFARRAYAAAPDDPVNREQLALLAVANSQRAALAGNADEACTLAEEAVRLTDRRNPVMLDWLSQCHATLGHHAASLDLAREALTLPNIGDYGSLASELAERLRHESGHPTSPRPSAP